MNNSNYETIYEMPPEELIVLPKGMLVSLIKPFTTCSVSADEYLKEMNPDAKK